MLCHCVDLNEMACYVCFICDFSLFIHLMFNCCRGLLIIFQGIGQARNRSTLDSDRLAFHSSRISKTGPHVRSLSLSLSLSHTHTHTHM